MQDQTRRDFIKHLGAGTVAAAAVTTATSPARAASLPASSRILGANGRINVGFVGCGGRMHTHIRHIVAPQQRQGRRAGRRRQRHLGQAEGRGARGAGVDEKSVYHDYRELIARTDVDAVVISSPDHWHHAHTMAALKAARTSISRSR